MPYVSDGRTLIRRAFEGRFAVPAFNVCSLEMARACLAAAEAERAPVILQTYPGDLEHAPPGVMSAAVRALADAVSVPVVLHLDHGDSGERVDQCVAAGYGSVMFDGERYPVDENVRRTREVAGRVHDAGRALEAAGGSFGGGESDGDGDPLDDVDLTDPELARRLFEEGDADMVACSVGSLHGRPSRLDLQRLRAIAEATSRPLVLHGGSGIPAEDLTEAAKLGVVKVNIGAALARSLLRVWLERAPGARNHYEVYAAARAALERVAREKLRATGASGRA